MWSKKLFENRMALMGPWYAAHAVRGRRGRVVGQEPRSANAAYSEGFETGAWSQRFPRRGRDAVTDRAEQSLGVVPGTVENGADAKASRKRLSLRTLWNLSVPGTISGISACQARSALYSARGTM